MSEQTVSPIPEDAPRAMYGQDGQPQFFQDPAMDRFVGVLLRLAQELWVLSERVDAIERVAQAKGVVTEAELRALAGDPAATAARDDALGKFVKRTLGALREP